MSWCFVVTLHEADGLLPAHPAAQEQAIAVWEQAQGERAAGRVPSVANFQSLLSKAQAKREGPATPEPAGEAATLRADSTGGLRRCAPNGCLPAEAVPFRDASTIEYPLTSHLTDAVCDWTSSSP